MGLITDGNEETVLVPNAAGLFVVQSAAELAPPPTRFTLAMRRLLGIVHEAENRAIEMMGVHNQGGMLRFKHINLHSDLLQEMGGEVGMEFSGQLAFEIVAGAEGENEERNVKVLPKKRGVWGRAGVHWEDVDELLPVLADSTGDMVVMSLFASDGALLGSCRCGVLDLTITPMTEVSLYFVEAERTLSQEEADKVQKERCARPRLTKIV